MSFAFSVAAQVDVDVNLNIKHSVDGISDFGRERHMTIHSSWTDQEWNGHEDMLDYLINDLDVYFGRDNGSATWKSRLMKEDPAKPHWPDVEDMAVQGANLKNWYETDANFKNDYQYEGKGDMIMGINPAPIYPTLAWDNNGWMSGDWQTWDVDASAFLVANYLDKYFAKSLGDLGEPLPTYWECINEPDMDMLTSHYMFLTSPEKLFEFHNLVAQETRALLGSMAPKIGGMTWGQHDFHAGDLVYRRDAQFYYDYSTPDIYPQYDNMLASDIWPNRKDAWFQWDGLWQSYIDATGENMDFHGVHIYDWPQANDEGVIRTGGHIEAMLDLMEWYDTFKHGERKDIVLSEFGSVSPLVHDLPYKRRDWENIRPFNQMFMQFLERPSHLVLTMPFAPAKAQWGDWFHEDGTLGERYQTTLMDPVGEYTEKPGESRYDHKDWEWSANILFFEQWSDVKGTRIDTKASDRDIQVDAYVDGTHVYLILNNLELDPTTINLNLFDDYQNEIVSVSTKHLYLNTSIDEPVLDRETMSAAPGSILLEKSATMILDYEFANEVIIDQESVEKKFMGEPLTDETNAYGSQLCHVKVNGRASFTANVNGVEVPEKGEAQLRIGLKTANTEKMVISINGHQLRAETDPSDWRGRERKRGALGWFGVFELDVPLEYLQTDNVIVCQNNGNTSEYSSFQIQTWDFTKEPSRSANGDQIAVTGISLGDPISIMQGVEQGLSVAFTPINASQKGITWASSNPAVATVNDNGVLTVLASSGTTTITATSIDGGFAATQTITAIAYEATPVTGVTISNGDNITIEHYTETPLEAVVSPLDASVQQIVWSSSDEDIVHVNPATGKLRGKTLNATATVTATVIDTESGDAVFTDEIEVFVSIAGSETVYCRDLPATLQPFESFSVNVPVRVTGAREVVVELTKDAGLLGSGTTSVDDFGDVSTSVEYQLASVPALGTGYTLTAKLMDGSTTLDVCSQEVEMVDHFRAESISIAEGVSAVQVGESIQLEANILPENTFNKAVVWSTSDETKATVDAVTGEVTGVVTGEVTITATSDDNPSLSDEVTITVQAGEVVVPIESIELATDHLNLYLGFEADIAYDLLPAWTTQTEVVWSSSDASIATVDQLGHVTASATEGTTVIKATAVADETIFAEAVVRVSKTLIIEAEELGRTGGPYDGWSANAVEINNNQTGDWGEYDVDIPVSGEYSIKYYIGAPATSTDAGVNIYVNGVLQQHTVVPAGTGWENYVAIDATENIQLSKGAANIRVESVGSSNWQWNMDKFELTNLGSTSVEGVTVTPETLLVGVTQTRSLTAEVSPVRAINKNLSWSSNNTSIATVDPVTGEVTGVAVGEAVVTATTEEGSFTDFCTVTVQSEIVAIEVESISVTPSEVTLAIGLTKQLTAALLPIDADDKTVTWSSSNSGLATVSASGLVTGVALGEVTITATAHDGTGILGTSTVSIVNEILSSIAFDDAAKYVNTTYEVGSTLDVSCTFQVGAGGVLDANGVTFWLRQVTAGWAGITKDIKVNDVSVAGLQNGTATASISLADLLPTNEIGTDFYFLWITFTPSGGQMYNKFSGASPINIIAASDVDVTGIAIVDAAQTIQLGSTYSLTATFAPAHATNKNVSWSTQDEAIATVVDGVVTATGVGTTTITVTTADGGFTDTIEVTVQQAVTSVTSVSLNATAETIKVGEVHSLIATVLPANATNKSISWSSDDPSIATVVEGKVTGIAAGTTIITVTTADGSKSASFEITVASESGTVTAIGQEAHQVKVYPNPGSSKIFIRNVLGYSQVSIVSLLGTTVLVQPITKEGMSIDISQIENGVYLMNFYGENGTAIMKIMVQH
ncbi:Ig-like domain-containing protein [Reichenbachiella carrageenanivorans]|uniref:Ig-like domain-containing protein n=1 Tax=Reichenbachiella carrageenanivorans TaxID=2979869 RepID=A0ABY6CZ01_9BACT|nr:Ig-like domain-containing protein [Reichenbachiella carrageenanivorans]UXX79142.1 Ig-like domain-containing protein [Reichenbachiella carrageenanivorans]